VRRLGFLQRKLIIDPVPPVAMSLGMGDATGLLSRQQTGDSAEPQGENPKGYAPEQFLPARKPSSCGSPAN